MRSLSPNAQIVTPSFDELAEGDGAPFWEACHDDVLWRTIGEGSWSDELAERATIPTRLIARVLPDRIDAKAMPRST